MPERPWDTSAPAKVILLGEHAVVYGQPAISLAVDLRMRCRVRPDTASSLNGTPLTPYNYSYVSACLDKLGSGPMAVTTEADFPSGSGLGSSAAVTVSLLAALAARKDGWRESDVARQAFEVESEIQGRASPIDTSTSTHGRGIFVKRERNEGLLWEISRDSRRWYVHDLNVPQMRLVIGFTGRSAPTGPLVAKVKRYVDRTRFASDIIEEIGQVTEEGAERLAKNDLESLGRLMTRDHKLLAILGVSSPELDKLVSAAIPYSYGAKLTGAGGGGSMVALTDDPLKVAEAIRKKGGQPFIASTGVAGVREEL